MLAALDFFIRDGGGSRGARAIRDAQGESVPMSKDGPLEEFRFRKEKDAHRDEQIVVRLGLHGLTITKRRNRSFDEDAQSFFERDWPAWLTGQIFDLASGWSIRNNR